METTITGKIPRTQAAFIQMASRGRGVEYNRTNPEAGATTMEDEFLKHLARLAKARRISFAELSRKIGRSDGYLGDMKLGRKASIKASDIVKLSAELRTPPADLMARLSPEARADLGDTEPDGSLQPIGEQVRFLTGATRKIPVYGRPSVFQPGIIMDAQPVAQTACPSLLEDVPGAYAVYIQDDDAAPRYHKGEKIFVDPNKPATFDSYVFVQMRGNPPIGRIWRYVRQSATELEVEHVATDKPHQIGLKDVHLIHRIVASSEN